MKNFVAASVAAFAIAGAAQASSVSVDVNFADLAAAIGEQGVEGQTFTFGGLDITVTSTHDAYLDDVHPHNGRPSGLGVCSVGLDVNLQCTTPSDDHVTNSAETLTLTFGQEVSALTNFGFVGRDHLDITGSTEELSFGISDGNGGFGGTTTFANIEADIATNAVPPIFTFSLTAITEAFYLNSFTVTYTPSPVPLPASVLLLGGAVAGLGVMRRRRKAA